MSTSTGVSTTTRWIGLSLGADLCWPLCFEHLLRRLDLVVPWQGEDVRVEVERVTIEPFDLRQPTKYTVVLDRLTHWYYTSREWIKKAVETNLPYDKFCYELLSAKGSNMDNPAASYFKHPPLGAVMARGRFSIFPVADW